MDHATRSRLLEKPETGKIAVKVTLQPERYPETASARNPCVRMGQCVEYSWVGPGQPVGQCLETRIEG